MDVLQALQEQDSAIVLQLHECVLRRPQVQPLEGCGGQDVPAVNQGIKLRIDD